MIYQLKITLKDSKPPIWRRLLVHADITFHQLHEIIQIAFQWGDYHLHEFIIPKPPADLRRNLSISQYFHYSNLGIIIGVPSTDDDYPVSVQPLDEREEKLSQWLCEEKDRMTYIYDFGDNWEHTIVLEKILEEAPDQSYPICLKVKGLAPEEDSRGLMLDGIPFVEAPPELITMINQELQEPGRRLGPSARRRKKQESIGSSSAPSADNRNEPWTTFYTLAKEFHRLEPWTWIADDQIFAVHDSETGLTGYCGVLGQGEELFGLVVYRGEQGLRNLHQLMTEDLTSGPLAEEFPYHQDAILLSYEDREELTPIEYQMIRSSGVKFRGRKAWPSIHDRKPGYATVFLQEEDVGFMTRVLQQAIEVCSRAVDDPELLMPTRMPPEQFFARISERREGQIIWRDGAVSAIPTKEQYEEELAISEFELAAIRKRARKIAGMGLEYDLVYMPVSIEEEERPYYPIFGLGVELEQGLLIPPVVAHPLSLQADLQRGLAEFFQTMEVLPEFICIQRLRVRHLLLPLCQALGIELRLVDELKVLSEAKLEFIQHFSGN